MLEKIIKSGSALERNLLAGGLALFSFGSCIPQDEPKQPAAKPVKSQQEIQEVQSIQPIQKSEPMPQPEPPETLQALQTQQNPTADNYREPKPQLEIITSGNGTLRDETFELTRSKAELILNKLPSNMIKNAMTEGTEVTYNIKNISDKNIRLDSIDSHLYEGDEEKLRIVAMKPDPKSERSQFYISPEETLEQILDIYVNELKKPYTPGIPIGTLAPGESVEYPFSTGFRLFGKLDKIKFIIKTDKGTSNFISYIPEKADFLENK